jgi:hypothetical protein
VDPSPIDLHAHPPERRPPRTVTLPCGSCCCCCCCLHTIGGLAGAAICSFLPTRGGARPYSPPDYYADTASPQAPPRPRSVISAAALYWIIFVVLMQLVFVVSCVGFGHGFTGPDSLSGVGGALLILAIFLPAVQLVASLLAMIAAAATDWSNAAARLWTIGKITLGTLLGTGVGIGAMFLLFLVCTAGH